MIDLTAQLLQRVRSVRPEPNPMPEPADDSNMRWSFRMAGAVLHCFLPETLRPLDSTFVEQKAWKVLSEDIVPVSGGIAEGLFTLKPAIRREALRQMGGTRWAMRQALQANPDRVMTATQRLWEDYLVSGTMPPAADMTYAELTRLAFLIDWLGDLDPALPNAATLQKMLRDKSVLANFEHLVINNFVGRLTDLSLIREHIGVLPPTRDNETFRQQLRQWTELKRNSILMIYGPGGIGKSALVGRLLWEHTQAYNLNRIPFAYLAFDQTTLLIESPYTLLLEMVSQFDLQMPELTSATALFKEQVSQYQRQRTALGERQETRGTRQDRIYEVQELDIRLYEQFVVLLQQITNRQNKEHVAQTFPALLVLDTFEEVQYRDRESMTGFWRMLDFLQDRAPTLRIIICGRSPVSSTMGANVQIRKMPLNELEVSDRVHLLTQLGVADLLLAGVVAKQVGGNPLSLRLAAEIIRKDSSEVDESGIKNLLFQVDEQLIQGQLYARILDHIHDKKVQQLAHPGMVLRRVNPDIIFNLLAQVCDIKVESRMEAQRLFDELRREHGLVKMGEDNTLLYRPEIRQAMIRLLKQDKFSDVRRLHIAAINYYQYNNSQGLVERAEEMYHRLALGEDDNRQLNDRWLPGIEKSIAANQEEYADEMLAWLASRMSLEVPRSVYINADIADWERNITRKVKYAISELQIQQALTLLAEKKERTPDSPLFALEAKVHMLQKELLLAWTVLEVGVQRVSESNNRGRLAELFWLQAQVALLRADVDQADDYLIQAEKSVEKAYNPTPFLHILCHRWMLREYYPENYLQSTKRDLTAKIDKTISRSPDLRARIDKTISRSSDELSDKYDLVDPPEDFVLELCRNLLSADHHKTAGRLEFLTYRARPIAKNMLTSENLRGLDEYRKPWEIEDSQTNFIASEVSE